VAGQAGSGGGGGGCWGDSTIPAHARLHGVLRNGLGAGRSSFLCSFLCPSRSLFLL